MCDVRGSPLWCHHSACRSSEVHETRHLIRTLNAMPECGVENPRPTRIASRGAGSFEVDLVSALHHERDVLKHRDILQWIADNSDNIGVFADLQ